jgi:hypothetical protein
LRPGKTTPFATYVMLPGHQWAICRQIILILIS